MRRAAKPHAKAKRAVEDAAVDHTLERDKERQNEPEKPEHPISSCDSFPSWIRTGFRYKQASLLPNVRNSATSSLSDTVWASDVNSYRGIPNDICQILQCA